MQQPKEPTQEELQAQLEGAKDNLIENMILYGYPHDQARIQIDSLLKIARRLAEVELY